MTQTLYDQSGGRWHPVTEDPLPIPELTPAVPVALPAPDENTRRILIAGWRHATWERHHQLVQDVLYPEGLTPGLSVPTLVHGQCHLGGIDLIADRVATNWGWGVERHPAIDHPTQGFGPWPEAGPRRNKYMASLRLDYAYLFPHRTQHRGTMDSMARHLVRAGVRMDIIPIN